MAVTTVNCLHFAAPQGTKPAESGVYCTVAEVVGGGIRGIFLWCVTVPIVVTWSWPRGSEHVFLDVLVGAQSIAMEEQRLLLFFSCCVHLVQLSIQYKGMKCNCAS